MLDMSTLELINMKMSELSEAEQKQVLDYLEWLAATRPLDDATWGELGARLGAETLEPDDFSKNDPGLR